MSQWHFGRDKGVSGDWPKSEDGSPVAPAFLEHTSGNKLELDMEISMLASFGIPAVCQYPNNGDLGNIILGFAGGGADIYVPETMLEDAKNIISGRSDANLDEEIE